MGMEILRPKALDTHPGDAIVTWSRDQLAIACSILDNPGGGLLSATQAIGQVRAALDERDRERWAEVVKTLERAEDAAVHREFATARKSIDQALGQLSPATGWIKAVATASSVASKPLAPSCPPKGPTP